MASDGPRGQRSEPVREARRMQGAVRPVTVASRGADSHLQSWTQAVLRVKLDQCGAEQARGLDLSLQLLETALEWTNPSPRPLSSDSCIPYPVMNCCDPSLR